jgi:peptidoglycan/xylan/chitin deacetylase (PgdA/CDA1 family)
LIKQAALNLMRVAGVFDLARMAARRRALIVTYHRFSAGEEEGKTSAHRFAEQLEYLGRHYRVVPLSELAGQIEGAERLEPGLAAITIDDGYRDAYEVAYPLLAAYGLPATLFVVTEFVDGRGWIWTDKARYLTRRAGANPECLAAEFDGAESWPELEGELTAQAAAERINATLKRLPDAMKEEALRRLERRWGVELPAAPPAEFGPVTWDQAREMEANGIEIGSHTCTHPILTLTGEERLRRELCESKSRLEEVLGRRVEQFCYPNGDNDGRVQGEVARAGYRVAVTCESGLNKRGDDPFSLRRIHTERDLAHFQQAVSGFEQMKEEMRRMIKPPGKAAQSIVMPKT